ncbi:MAG: nucleotidyltransferase domain-containing protein [Candidatus Dormibacteraceae bacterium]
MGLLRSDIAALEVLALEAGGPLSLSALARAVETTPSAVQRGLAILALSGVVERIVYGSRPAFQLTQTEIAGRVLDLVLCETSLERMVRVGARANPAIEFVSRADASLAVVFSSRSSSVQQSVGARYLDRIAHRAKLDVREFDHDDVRKELLWSPDLREEVRRSEILYGDLDRSFPDRSGHGLDQGLPLYRPAPSLRLPPLSFCKRLARRYGLASLDLFGSAVRSDFRQDSDVDILIRYRTDCRPTLKSLIGLRGDLERALDRDVEVVREDLLLPDFASTVREEAVALL